MVDILCSDDIDELMRLFWECFQNDWYYSNQSADIKDNFRDCILQCINLGDCYGIRDNGKLVAFYICFDYQLVKGTELYDSIFYRADVLTYKIDKVIADYNVTSKILYGLSIGVSRDYRGNGLASKLFDYAISNCSMLLTDVDSEVSKAICDNRGFMSINLSEDSNLYYLCYKELTKNKPQ